MARISVSNEVELMLSRLAERSGEVCARALYEGAKVLADEMRREIEALPTDDRNHHIDPKNPAGAEVLRGPKTAQKQGLLDSLGIAPFRSERGAMSTHLGFDGYNGIRTEKWPNGQPNSMIARSVNAGTYFMQAHPFIDRVKRKGKDAAARMEEVIKDEVKE